MSNDFYNESGDPVTLNRGASSAIRNEYIKVRQGFDKMPTLVQIFGGSSNYVGLDGGAANAYSATGSANIVAYGDGLTVCFKVANSNTAGSTFNLNSIGAVSIVRPDGTALQANDLYAGQFATITYSATASHWVLNHNSLASANAAAASASAAASYAGAASASAGAASSSAGSASSSSSSASSSATLSSQWASTTGALVAATDYSAKEYAVGTFTRGTTGSAKDWATYTGATVNASEYSAKEYAQGATVSTGSAKDWAQKTSAAVTGSSYSSKEWATGTQTRGTASGGSAKDWATYTAGTVDNAEHSAKYYANLAAGYTLPFVDSTALIKGSADATKLLRFEVDGNTTGTTRVATPPDADFNMAGTNLQQAFTKPQRPSLSAEAAPSSNTVTWDLTTDSVFRINLSANITTFNLTGTLASLAGYQFQTVVRYNGGTTIAWNAAMKLPGTVTLTGTSGKVDIFNWVVSSTDGTNFYLLCTGYSQNLG